MLEYERMVSDQRKWMLYLLGLLALGYGLTPYPKVFLGLFLGSTISFLNMSLLQQKVKAFGEVITGKGTVFSLGSLTRLATVGLTIGFSLKFKDKIHIGSVVIGLMISYVVMMIDMFVRTAISVRNSEKGMNNDQSNDTSAK